MPHISPRILLCLALFAPACISTEPEGAREIRSLNELAERIHSEALVIETHSDTTPLFETDWDFSARHEDGHMDLPRIREGGLDAIFFSIWMGRTPGEGRAIKTAIDRIDSVHEAVRRWPDQMALATTADQLEKAVRKDKLAVLMGVEGGHIIEDDLRALRTYYRLGVRYMTLTHSFNTNWADSAGTDVPPEALHGGLTAFGEEVVREMNRLGMMVDISHVADSTFWDVLRVSEAPLVATHSSCRAVADHPRNMSDAMLRSMAEKGGVIQINFFPGYIDPAKTEMAKRLIPQVKALYEQYPDDPERAREERIKLYEANDPGPTPASVVVDHIVHVIELVGDDHVGLGADWDGVPSMPVGLEDCSTLSYISAELLRRGYEEETIGKVLGGNLLRVMRKTEKVAARLAEG
jgi:membrane dipeptidase